MLLSPAPASSRGPTRHSSDGGEDPSDRSYAPPSPKNGDPSPNSGDANLSDEGGGTNRNNHGFEILCAGAIEDLGDVRLLVPSF